jgi:hypothetical protein
MILQIYPCGMTAFLRHKKDILYKLLVETDFDKAGLSDSDKDIDTDTDTNTNRHNKESAVPSESQVYIWSGLQDTWNSGGVHPYTGGPSGLRIQEVPHMNMDSTPIIVFLLFFREVIQLLVAGLVNATTNT